MHYRVVECRAGGRESESLTCSAGNQRNAIWLHFRSRLTRYRETTNGDHIGSYGPRDASRAVIDEKTRVVRRKGCARFCGESIASSVVCESESATQYRYEGMIRRD